MKRHFPILLLAGFFSLMAGPVFGQGKVKITGLSRLGNSITLTLQNTVSIPPTPFSTGFRLEGSPDLGATPWATTVPHSPFVQGPPGFWSATFTQPAGTRYFFRPVGILGTATDPDGDGLDATQEGLLGTNSGLWDSDFDGFSDGVEFAYGMDPLNPASHPVFDTSRPTVNFVLANSTATEGTSPHQVQILFDRNYSGTVNYSVNSLSNTVAGTDYTVGAGGTATTGSLTINGTSASIPITLIDDSIVSGQRVIILDLQLNVESYFIGGRASHIVLLNDNDAWWSGTLVPASGDISSRILRVKIAHQGATTTAVFGAGAGNDGLPVPGATTGASGTGTTATITFYGRALYPTGSSVTISGVAPAGYNGTYLATASAPGAVSFASSTTGAQTTAGLVSPSGGTSITGTSISTSMFPSGTYPGTGVVDSATQFQADSPQVAIPPGSICNQSIVRQLHLNAQPTLNTATHPHSLLPGVRYVGDYAETLTTPAGALLGTLPGSFILMRDIPAPLPVLSKLVP